MKNFVSPQRFHILDIMRTLAAVVVAERHTGKLLGGGTLPGGYLAVDFFFVLSGFVIASAYEDRLTSGMSTLRFMQIRVIRLYPLYVFSLGIGALAYCMNSRLLGTFDPSFFVLAVLAGLVFVPLPFRLSEGEPQMFAFNPPSWTLLFELFANLCHGLFLKSMRTKHLLITIAVSGILLVAAVVYFGSLDLGYKRSTFLTGFPRVIFSYAVGILIYRTNIWRASSLNLPIILAPLVLILILSIPGEGNFRIIIDVVCATVVFPCLVIFSTNLANGQTLSPVLLRFGAASYAIYVIHFPLFRMLSASLALAGIKDIEPLVPYLGTAFLGAVVLMAIALDAYFDAPVRAALLRLLKRRTVPVAISTAP